ncbi:MAG: methyltransferase domain-containing protein [Verrucomicrobia bacterium]|nr:methyltransferase domain-containing protein [Verrucomicrobiota bacterium]
MKDLLPDRFAWSRRTAGATAEIWFEKLSHLGPMRVMVTQNAGSHSAKVQAHGLTKDEALSLKSQHGGTISEATWLTSVNTPQRAPIRIRGKLAIVSTEAERQSCLESEGIPALWIPASLAFGTGEHATTAMCLRHLADIARPLAKNDWSFLDLGTGSAILAMAASLFGAKEILGTDYDALALRTARENLVNNNVRSIKLKRSNVLKWKPTRTWDVVAANLFSGVLIQAAPNITASLRSEGKLLLSGVLRSQEKEVLSCFERLGVAFEKVSRKGKWISARGTRTKY